MWESKQQITLAIVDDHPIVTQGLMSLLSENERITVVGTFTKGGEFLSFLAKEQVDIVLLDIMLPDVNGLDLCIHIKRAAPSTAILMISNHAERSIVMQALQNGAGGYLLKNASLTELISAINEALRGKAAFSNEIMEIIARADHQKLVDKVRLTKREQQVLQMIAQGNTTAMMGETLFVSPLTVETHRRNLMQKFGVRNAAELIMEATKQGFL